MTQVGLVFLCSGATQSSQWPWLGLSPLQLWGSEMEDSGNDYFVWVWGRDTKSNPSPACHCGLCGCVLACVWVLARATPFLSVTIPDIWFPISNDLLF